MYSCSLQRSGADWRTQNVEVVAKLKKPARGLPGRVHEVMARQLARRV